MERMTSPRRLPWDGALTLVRHGETDFNAQDKFLGVLDEPLNDNGLAQARKAASWLERWAKEHAVSFDVVVSSPLRRCHQTATIIGATFDLDVQVEPLLVERNYGAFEGMRKKDAARRYPETYAAYKARKATTRPPGDGAEVVADIEARVDRFLNETLPRKHHAAREIVVVTHLNPIRACYRLLGLADESIYYTPFANTSLSRILVRRDGDCSFAYCDENPSGGD